MADQTVDRKGASGKLLSVPLRRQRRASKGTEASKETGVQTDSEFSRFLSENNPDAAIEALELVFRYGQLRDSREQAWLIDQIVRRLTGENYDAFVETYSFDEEFGHSYSWDQGLAPNRIKP